jgi:HlyD family secretion protein
MRKAVLITLAAPIFLGIPLACYFARTGTEEQRLALSTVVRRELSVVVSTNGIIEPQDRIDLLAPIDGFVANLLMREGSEVAQGVLMMHLESQPLMTALAAARAALLQAKSEARTLMAGPTKEEVAAVEAPIAEVSLQLTQQRADLVGEESLLRKGASTREAVENLRKQASLLEVRLAGLRQKQEGLLHRYAEDEKQLQQSRVEELSRQVDLFNQQVRMASILAPKSGIIYSLTVNPGSYVNRGQLLAQLYQPGRIRLRAYVDEPDLGRIQKGQRTLIGWDGLPDQHWQGVVDQPAKQVVALGARSVGYVICTIAGNPKELIPNTNVKIQIVTASKATALVVPRTAVFNQNGKAAVMWSDGEHTALKSVTLGLVTPEEIEILAGIEEGSKVVTNPGEAKSQ